jgi:hypothetical protein
VRAARRLTFLTVGDGPEPWQAAGFQLGVDPPDGTNGTASLTVGGVRIQLVGDHGGRGLLGWGFEPAWTVPIDGLPVATAPPTRTVGGAVTGATTQPNGVIALDHVVVTSPDVERTTAAPRGGRDPAAAHGPGRARGRGAAPPVLPARHLRPRARGAGDARRRRAGAVRRPRLHDDRDRRPRRAGRTAPAGDPAGSSHRDPPPRGGHQHPRRVPHAAVLTPAVLKRRS